MDDQIEHMAVRVRADTRGFAQDVAAMRGSLEGSLAGSAEIAGRRIEHALLRAARTGKFGFDELRGMALGVMDEIARAALRGGLGAIGGGNSGGLVAALAGLLGAPGRATGGPVSPARPYWVGERGPELFVPASAGSVVAPVAAGPREVRVAITVNASAGEAPRALAQSGRQVARAVKAALAGVE
jgi:hypothetical protein